MSSVPRIKEAIAAYGITPQLLHDKRAAVPTQSAKSGKARTAQIRRSAGAAYSDGSGNVWGGCGPRPRWLRDALAGGTPLDDFRSR
ncbi:MULTISPECIES: H-NS family nucleoid-associated regulatory protein [unclassified Variovorax]|uniref:H-NS family nucleoid-associated regulatory protein n=1 Tax=unclassified Variovorax TaxID=663243 RepID=UPI000B84D875|nr:MULTISPECIES: H-NS family nucleoid-associated regulatory protein [unclassified Variovorax]